MIGERVSHYRVLSKLGGGGMGVVYEAEDTRLHRRVALKFVAENSADTEALQRFRREAEAASALNHPHICTIYDVGEHDGRPFIVMEKLEGRTLRETIGAKPLPVDELLKLGSKIADALSAAHGAGIIHRDIKPANLFVTARGDAKLLDFGLARLESPQGGAPPAGPESETYIAPEQITSPGSTLGTIAYMSPEQAFGAVLDPRSDLFSLGTVLYEMATGIAPFRGVTQAAILDGILHVTPDPPSRVNSEIPPALDQIILGCLEKKTELRIQSAAELKAQLLRVRRDSTNTDQPASAPAAAGMRAHRRFITIVAAGLALIVGSAYMYLHATGTSAASRASASVTQGRKRIAVLPFENLGSPDDAYFADGMTDEVRGKLSRLSGLAVIARASSNEYRQTRTSPQVIAEQLGVTYLLTATVRWQKTGTASRIRVSPELVEISAEGAPVTRWQQPYEADLADVFEVQARIATEVAEALELALGTKDTERLAKSPTSNVAAYDAFTRGNLILSRDWGPASQREAAGYFEKAVALDPQFGPAWAQLGSSLALLHRFTPPPPELTERARFAAENAMALAPDLPESRVALGMYQRYALHDRAAANATFRAGLRLWPENVSLLRELALCEKESGNYDEALSVVRRTMTVDPRSADNLAAVANILIQLRRTREARELIDRALAIHPERHKLIFYKVTTLLQDGNVTAAQAATASIRPDSELTALGAYLELYPENTWVFTAAQRDEILRLQPSVFDGNNARWSNALASEYRLRGNAGETRRCAEEARRAFEKQIETTPGDGLLHALLAETLATLGRKSEAEQSLERAAKLLPKENDLPLGWTLCAIAIAQTRLGNQERALDALDRLLNTHHPITPAWLAVDPNFAPLRGNPRFDRMISDKA